MHRFCSSNTVFRTVLLSIVFISIHDSNVRSESYSVQEYRLAKTCYNKCVIAKKRYVLNRNTYIRVKKQCAKNCDYKTVTHWTTDKSNKKQGFAGKTRQHKWKTSARRIVPWNFHNVTTSKHEQTSGFIGLANKHRGNHKTGSNNSNRHGRRKNTFSDLRRPSKYRRIPNSSYLVNLNRTRHRKKSRKPTLSEKVKTNIDKCTVDKNFAWCKTIISHHYYSKWALNMCFLCKRKSFENDKFCSRCYCSMKVFCKYSL